MVRQIDAGTLKDNLTDIYGDSENLVYLYDILDLIDAQPTLTPPNEPLTCEGCMYAPDLPYEVHCRGCARLYTDHYRRPPEAKDNNVPTNEPLTIEELLKMDGEPVYVVFMPDSSGKRSQSWALVNVDKKYGEVYLVDSIPGASCYYDEIWADLEGIYRRPPEGEEDT